MAQMDRTASFGSAHPTQCVLQFPPNLLHFPQNLFCDFHKTSRKIKSPRVFRHLDVGRVLGDNVVEVADGDVAKPLDEKLRAKREQPKNYKDFHLKAKAKIWWDCLCCAISRMDMLPYDSTSRDTTP